MSIEDGKCIYKFKKKFTYSLNGQMKQAEFLELREPGMSHSGGYYKIKQTVTGVMISGMLEFEKLGFDKDEIVSGTAVKRLHDKDPDEHENESNELSEMLSMLFGFSDKHSLDHLVSDFSKIACKSGEKSICAIDGEQMMNSDLWKLLHPEDACAAALKWASFFCMPSMFQEKSGSDNRSE